MALCPDLACMRLAECARLCVSPVAGGRTQEEAKPSRQQQFAVHAPSLKRASGSDSEARRPCSMALWAVTPPTMRVESMQTPRGHGGRLVCLGRVLASLCRARRWTSPRLHQCPSSRRACTMAVEDQSASRRAPWTPWNSFTSPVPSSVSISPSVDAQSFHRRGCVREGSTSLHSYRYTDTGTPLLLP